jgi:hypothetical protein
VLGVNVHDQFFSFTVMDFPSGEKASSLVDGAPMASRTGEGTPNWSTSTFFAAATAFLLVPPWTLERAR